ncbi:MAG: diguanylate cyclase [Porticoccaceae bacterium]|nr:diguanylate cyclase [Porticoccaceae bacterium]
MKTRFSRRPLQTILLRRWVPLLSIVIPALVFLLWAVVHYFNLHERRIDDIKARWQNTFLLGDAFLEQSKVEPDMEYFRGILQTFSNIPTLEVLAVITPDNRVLFSIDNGEFSSKPAPIFDDIILNDIVLDEIRGGKVALFVDHSDWFIAYHPIQIKSDAVRIPAGYLIFVAYSHLKIHDELLSLALKDTVWPLLIILFLTLFISMFIRRFINLPLQELLVAMEGFSRGERVLCDLKGNGEFGLIAGIYNRSSSRALSLMDELRDREQYLERIFESVADGIIITDAYARITLITSAAESIIARNRDEVVGLPLDEVFRPVSRKDKTSIENAGLMALESGQSVGLTNGHILINASGQERHIVQTAAPLFDLQGHKEGVVLIFRDITAISYARIEQRIGAVAFESAQPIIIASAGGEVLRANSATYKAGFYQEELVGTNIANLYENVEDSELEEFFDHPGTKGSWAGRTVRTNSEGLPRHLIETITSVRDESDVLTHFVVTQRDISDLVETDIALRESESRARLLIQSMSDGVGLFNEEGCCLECNQALSNILGRDESDILDKQLSEFSGQYQGDGIKSAKRWAELFATTNRDSELEWQVLHTSGKQIDLRLGVVAVTTGRGAEFLITFHDITKRKERDARTRSLVSELTETEKTARLAAIAGQVAIFDLDIENGEISWLEGTESAIGFPEDMVGQSLEMYRSWMLPEDSERFDDLLAQSEVGGRIEFEQCYPREEGDIWVKITGEVERSTDGKLILRGTVVNITDAKMAHLKLTETERTTRLAALAGQVGIFDIDLENTEIHWLEGSEEAIGFPEMIGQSLETYRSWMPVGDYERLYDLVIRSFEAGGGIEFEQCYPRKDGDIWLKTTGEVERDAEGKLILHGAVVNVTAAKTAHLAAEKMAYYDPLTGLANRRLLLDRLEQACVHAKRKKITGALLFIDLDHFKSINDSLGHKAGDELLKQVSNRLTEMLREEDTVARLGGDEFVVILPELSHDEAKAAHEAKQVAEKIISVVGANHQLSGQSCQLQASVGVALFPRNGEGHSLLDHADMAMYKAKEERNSVVFYDSIVQH